MEISGKRYGFLLSVGAEQEIAKLCPNEDLGRFREILQGKSAAAIDNSVEMICILSRWHEKAQSLERGTEYKQDPLTKERILLLPVNTFQELQAEALACMLRDQQRSVEAEASKKGKAPGSN